MLKSQEEYEKALQELQEFLDAPKAPPVGSAQAEYFANLLDAIAHYEEQMVC